MNRPGFTLIETMLAMLLMALLASSVALSFSAPLQAARAEDALDLIRSFDADCRQAAISSGHNVRLVLDLSAGKLVQQEGPDLSQLRRQVSLPSGCRIDSIKIAGSVVSLGQTSIDISSLGWSRSYSVHLVNPASNRWLVFAGLSGQMTQVQNESQIPKFSAPARHDAD